MKMTAISSLITLTLTLLHLHSTHTFLIGEKIGPLNVASFNVRHFGRGFMKNKEEVVTNLVKIMNRYDIVLVLETRDKSGTAIDDLKKKLSNYNSVEPWDYIASERLGKSRSYMEQYVFFYKKNSASVVKSYQVSEKDADSYLRPPFSVEFSFPSSRYSTTNTPFQMENVVLLALHTSPTDTPEELQELPRIIRTVASKFPKSAGVIAIGDFNADCKYLTGKLRKSVEIFNGKDFISLIPDSADTTTKESTNCAYDRVVLYGRGLKVTKANVFDYQTWLNLDQDAALEVSDHYPVEFTLH